MNRVFIDQMGQGKKRVVEDHSGPAESHNLDNLFSHCCFVAVHGAFPTRRLLFLERAGGQPAFSVFRQLHTFITETGSLVVSSAVETNHGKNCFKLAGETRVQAAYHR